MSAELQYSAHSEWGGNMCMVGIYDMLRVDIVESSCILFDEIPIHGTEDGRVFTDVFEGRPRMARSVAYHINENGISGYHAEVDNNGLIFIK